MFNWFNKTPSKISVETTSGFKGARGELFRTKEAALDSLFNQELNYIFPSKVYKFDIIDKKHDLFKLLKKYCE